jgi:hypothetical protein
MYVTRTGTHKVFKDFAQKSKSSTGWFYGFKLHLAINDKGEIIACCTTPGNVDDRDWNVISRNVGCEFILVVRYST